MANIRYRDSCRRKFIRTWHRKMIESLSETNLLATVRTKLF